jgi:Ran-interacting Mog1 protein
MSENHAQRSNHGGRPVKNPGPILMSPGGTISETFGRPSETESTGFDQNEKGSKLNGKVCKSSIKEPSKLLNRDLFGGAIRCSIPGTFEDVSVIREVTSLGQLMYDFLATDWLLIALNRSVCTHFLLMQVPDHQEVFVDRESELSLIVELLEYEESVTDDKAAAHYFNDLAQCNEVYYALYALLPRMW